MRMSEHQKHEVDKSARTQAGDSTKEQESLFSEVVSMGMKKVRNLCLALNL